MLALYLGRGRVGPMSQIRFASGLGFSRQAFVRAFVSANVHQKVGWVYPVLSLVHVVPDKSRWEGGKASIPRVVEVRQRR